MFKEFRKFILRGNMVDLAVGLIIGSAFTAVVNSLVNDIVMPPIGYLTGGVDFSNLAIQLGSSEAAINYGLFINNVINLLIVGFVVFMIVRGMNAMVERARQNPQDAEEAALAKPDTDEKILEALEKLNATLESMNK